MPNAVAVFRLTTNSKLIGISAGMSVGLAPLRIAAIWRTNRRDQKGRSGPYDIKPPFSGNCAIMEIAGMRYPATMLAM